MVHQKTHGVATPSVNVAINKSRLKTYTKGGEAVHYLKKGAEFQIELFNPTTDTVSARISINGKRISQRGLVLKPGVRIFLDRYLDVAAKFKFDTYEVSNTKEVQKAIEDNGSIEVDFYREVDPNRYKYFDTTPYYKSLTHLTYTDGSWIGDDLTVGRYDNGGYDHTFTSNQSSENTLGLFSQINSTGMGNVASASMDSMRSFAGGSSAGLTGSINNSSSKYASNTRVKKRLAKSIETGRVEKGSHSNQTFTDVNLEFETYPFYTKKLKLLPESVKQITTSELNKRRYCTNCGSKNKTNFKFCPNCGTKV